MMSKWLNERAIARDLSLAQGHVPVTVDGALGAGEKPPTVKIVEETEEEFYNQFIGDEDGTVLSPDLDAIQELLKMVSETDDTTEESTETDFNSDTSSPMTKLSRSKFSVKNYYNSSKEGIADLIPAFNEPLNKRKSKNIAVESILNLKVDKEYAATNLVLLKPDDFKPSLLRSETDISHAPLEKPSPKSPFENQSPKALFEKSSQKELFEKPSPKVRFEKPSPKVRFEKSSPKVLFEKSSRKILFEKPSPTALLEKSSPKAPIITQSLKAPLEKPCPKSPIEKPKKRLPILDPSCLLFKKKDSTEKPTNMFKPVKIKSPTQKYIPSTAANNYYEQYIERSKVKQLVVENIWEKAEREMKEIDERRRLEEIAEMILQEERMKMSEQAIITAADGENTHTLNDVKANNVTDSSRGIEIEQAKNVIDSSTGIETELENVTDSPRGIEIEQAKNVTDSFRGTETEEENSVDLSRGIEAERPNNVIDSSRGIETEQSQVGIVSSNKFDVIRLASPRHLADEPCIVCNVLIDNVSSGKVLENWRLKPKNQCYYEDYNL